MKIDQHRLDAVTSHSSCKECALSKTCLFAELSHHDSSPGDRIVRRHVQNKGEVLYRAGELLKALYVVQRGCIRTGMSTRDGEVRVLGFHAPGDLLGIDAIDEGHHASEAVAIEETLVCEFPYASFEALMHELPALQHRFLSLLNQEIAREEELMRMLGQWDAESRLASCLLDLNERYGRADPRGDWLKLSMSRTDLGNYLGLALETTSRLFARFQEEGLLAVIGRYVKFLDFPRLQAMQALAVGLSADTLVLSSAYRHVRP